MISLILPYWERQEAANKALAMLWNQYAPMFKAGELEVVIVDDGSPTPFHWPTAAAWANLNVIRLPAKTEPRSPVTCWNEGVKAAKGDIIAISCIEVLHDRGPVLQPLLNALQGLGENGYVLAAAWCPETREWHCHSEHAASGSYPIPAGTGRGFLGLMHKELYWSAGGWDEEYRDGAGYEDVDFIYRLLQVGAKFKVCDDLVVTHPKTGAAIAWGEAKFARNKALFERKWMSLRKVTVACVQAGNYCGRGADYVNALYDMVVRNMPPGVLFRFVCLTDDAAGLHADIETIALPDDLEGWYGKLYLFKRGLFADGERVIFMDLDTLVIGRLDDLVRYDGQFATLDDFYYPERIGPAVMAWKVGDYSARIWGEWEAQGQPRNELGDLWWLNNLDEGRFAENADRLQKLYPGSFVSYKKHCRPLPPKGARVVCFHGRPRPHEVQGWVAEVWKVDGMQPADLEFVINTKDEEVTRNIRAACELPHPWLDFVKPHGGEAVIVGGGPSLPKMLDDLRQRVRNGAVVYAANGAFEYLCSRGVVPDYHVIIDARPENAAFITQAPKRGYLLASQVAPVTLERAAKLAPVTIVHMSTAGIDKIIPQSIKPVNLISSGITVGLAALAVSYCMGYRRQSLYGMDSSYEDTRHAYPQGLNDSDPVVEASVEGRRFKCAPWMIEQVQNFQKLATDLADDGCEIHVRSFGMLGHVAWLMMKEAA